MNSTVNDLLSKQTNDTTLETEKYSFYYQGIGALWKTVIMANTDFSALQTIFGLVKVLDQHSRSGQVDVGFDTKIDTPNGKRKRTMEDIGDDDSTKSPTMSWLQIVNGDTASGSTSTTSENEHFDSLLVGMLALSGILTLRRKHLDEEQFCRFTSEWSEGLVASVHLSILTSMHDLAKILMAQNKDEEAEELLRFTVGLMEKELEPDNPDIMDSTSSLALVLTKLCRYDEAEAIYRKTLKLKNKVLMWDDPSTQETLCHLDILLKKQGKLEKAAELVLSYRLPAMIKSVLLGTFPYELHEVHVGLIDDHHDDDDVRKFLESGSLAVTEIKICLGDDSLAIELLLDPEDLRIIVIVSRRALMIVRHELQKTIKNILEHGIGDWKDFGIDTFVGCIDRDDSGKIWALPHRLEL